MDFNKVKFTDKDFTIVDDNGTKFALLRHDDRLYAIGAELIGPSTGGSGGGGGTRDQGSLTGLSDDDHVQYLLAGGSRVLAGAWDMGSQNLTNVDIDSGTIDNAIIGGATPAAITGTTLIGTSLNVSDGNITNVGNVALDSLSADGSSISLNSDLFSANNIGIVIGHSAQIAFGEVTPEVQFLGTSETDAVVGIGLWQTSPTQSPSLKFIKGGNGTIGGNTIMTDGEELAKIQVYADDGVDHDTLAAEIMFTVDDATPAAGQIGGEFILRTATAAGVMKERMSVDASGNVIFNNDSEASNFTIESDGEADMFVVDGANNRIGVNTNAPTCWFDVRGGGASATSIFEVRGTRTTGNGHCILLDPAMNSDTDFTYTIRMEPQAKGDGQIGAINIAPFIWPDNGTGPHTNNYGMNMDMRFKGTATISNAWANFIRYKHESDRIATTTNGIAYGIATPSFAGSSTKPVNMHGMRIENQGASGQTICYGIRLFAQSGATTNYNILSEGASTLNKFEGEVEIDGALNHDGTTFGLYGTAPTAQSSAYSVSNVTPDRSYDADAVLGPELADVLGTLIADLQLTGIIG